jgi:hypothetical protein
LTATLNASLAGAAPVLEAAIPSDFSASQCGQGPFPIIYCIDGTILREPLVFSIIHDQINVFDEMYYQAEGFLAPFPVSGTCGVPDNTKRRAAFSMSGNAHWNPNWTLDFVNATTSVTPGDRCQVTLANLDETDRVMQTANRLVGMIPKVAETHLKQFSLLHDQAATGWSTLQQPIVATPQVTIALNPNQVQVSPIEGRGEVVSAIASITMRPVIYVGEQPPAQTSLPLPPLMVGTTTPGFFLEPIVSTHIDTVNQYLSGKLTGQVIRGHIPILPDPKVTIIGTKLVASGENLALGVDLKGFLRGTAWVTGKLTYDQSSRMARLDQLDFSPETKARLEHIAPIIAQRLMDQAVRMVSAGYSFDVGTQSDALITGARSALNRDVSPSVTLHATINEPTISGPYTDATSFLFPVSMQGTVSADIKPFADTLPTGKEIRMIAVTFFTDDDDKDAEETVDVWVDLGQVGGHPLAHRALGTAERWDDQRSQGPYYLVLGETPITDCGAITLNIRKQPVGSDQGKGWNMHMQADLIRADGTQKQGGHLPYMHWGNGNPYEHRLSLCDSGN